MPLSDMYELKHYMAFGAVQDVMNVYHFERQSAEVNAEDLATKFAEQVVPGIRSVQTAGLDHLRLEARNLDDPTDFYIVSLAGLSGTVTGERLNTFTSYKIQFLRRRTDMKHGYKRIPGVAESDVNGEVISSTPLAALNSYADGLTAGIDNGGEPPVTLFRFAIIARICAEFNSTLGICVEYRLPENDLELKYYIPTQYNVSQLVTSQVSRRR